MFVLWERVGTGWIIKSTCEEAFPLHKSIGLMQCNGNLNEFKVLQEGIPPASATELLIDNCSKDLPPTPEKTIEQRLEILEEQNKNQDRAINLLVDALKASQEIITKLGN